MSYLNKLGLEETIQQDHTLCRSPFHSQLCLCSPVSASSYPHQKGLRSFEIQWKTLNTPRQKNPFYCKQIWRSLDGMCCGPGAPFICVVIYLFTISPASISWLHPWDRGRGKKPPNYLPIFAPSAAPFSYLCPKSCNMTLYVFFVYSCLHILDVSSLREFLSKFNAWMNKWIRGKTLKEEKRLPNGQMNMSKKGGIWSLRVLVFKTDHRICYQSVPSPGLHQKRSFI